MNTALSEVTVSGEFERRQDVLRRLITEAAKLTDEVAVAEHSDVDIRQNVKFAKMTALLTHIAVWHCRDSVVDFLVERNADQRMRLEYMRSVHGVQS